MSLSCAEEGQVPATFFRVRFPHEACVDPPNLQQLTKGSLFARLQQHWIRAWLTLHPHGAIILIFTMSAVEVTIAWDAVEMMVNTHLCASHITTDRYVPVLESFKLRALSLQIHVLCKELV